MAGETLARSGGLTHVYVPSRAAPAPRLLVLGGTAELCEHALFCPYP